MPHDVTEGGWSPQGPVVELSDQDSWELLAGKNFGHLGVSHQSRPDIFPVNYYSDGVRILFRTATGSKLVDLNENRHVAFEVDAETPGGVWSVVIHGSAAVVDVSPVLSATLRDALPPWTPVKPFRYVEITPETIRGRLFEHHLPIGHL